MNNLKAYKIGFKGLSFGHHSFLLNVDRSLFDTFEQSEIHESEVKLSLDMEKGENMLVLDFAFKGWINLDCDRCLDAYRQEVDFSRRLFVKFGEEFAEQSEEVTIIPYGESHVDIAQYVYEFLHLALPIRRIHPDTAAHQPGCNPEMLDRFKGFMARTSQVDGSHDPAWEALKKLNFDSED